MFLLAIFDSFLYSLTEIFYKKTKNDSEIQSVFINTIMQFITTILIIVIFAFLYGTYKPAFNIGLGLLGLIILAQLLNFGALFGFMYGVKYSPLSVVSPIASIVPVPVAVVSFFIFDSSTTVLDWAYIVVVCISVMFLSMSLNKDGQEMNNAQYIKGIFGGLIYVTLMACLIILEKYIFSVLNINILDYILISRIVYLIIGILVFMIFDKNKKSLKKYYKTDFYMYLGGFMESISDMLYLFIISVANIAISEAILSTYTIITLLISRSFLREKLKNIEYFYVGLMIIGIIGLSYKL